MAGPSETDRPHVGPYTVFEEIGRGGMSTVHRATQTSIGREVAIKVLLSSLVTQDPTFLDRFRREVQVAAHLQHPRILAIYDFGETNGHPYIVMSYVKGGTLVDRIRQGPMSLSEVFPILTQIADALDFSHSRNVVHRDFKPSNVLLDEQGNAYLTDFGLAKVSDAALELTGSALVGTPDYMAPDLASADGVSPAVDIYALGVTLFQMLTGHVPFRASTPMGTLMAHLSQPVPDVRVDRPDLPETVQQVIATAMAKRAEDRYATAGTLAEALRAAANEPQHTPNALLFTDIQGQVIFVNNILLKMLGRGETEIRGLIGRPVHEVLGLRPEATRQLIQEVARIGRVYNRAMDLIDRDGRVIPVSCTGEATYDEKGACIGADLSFRTLSEVVFAAVPLAGTAGSMDTSDRTYLQLYFTSQLDALRVLLLRVGGPHLGQTMDRILNEASARNSWPIQMNDGRVEIDALRAETHAYHALLAKAVSYAQGVIGPKIVERQMRAVDDQMGERSRDLANQLGLRELIQGKS